MTGDDTEKSKLFTRRAFLIGAAEGALLSLLTGRLYYLQIVNGEKFKTLADDNRINLRLIAPHRGQILDRNDVELAVNQQSYRLVVLPEQVDDLSSLLDKLARFVELGEQDRKRIFRDKSNQSNFNALLIKDNLTWEQVAALSVHSPDLPGTDIDTGEVRNYPFEAATAHLLGYVGIPSDRDKSKEDDEEDSVLSVPGFRIGKSGIEKQYELPLRGEAGTVQMEINAHGRVVRELSRENPVPGKPLKLAIDSGLQQYVQQRLMSEESAAAIVMDVHTGAIYALASHPGFDPNLFTYGISQNDWDGLINNPYNPMLNKVVSGVYAPGSTIKPAMALAGLESGMIDPGNTIFCPGYYDLGNYRMHCWKHGGHGTVNMRAAIAGSCDTYFYDLGRKVGIDRIQTTLRRMGFGEKSGIDMPHEKSGLVPGRTWKLATFGKLWQQGETLNTAIGQGYMLATPLQLAIMAARIANGGKAITPHLALSIGTETAPSPTPSNIGINTKHLDFVRDAMSAVVNETIGTAYSARITTAGMEMAGKTGTAQVRRISESERAEGVIANDALAWEQRDHALFTGFAPVGNPRFAIGLVIEHGGSGGHTAAPIARDILSECQQRIK